MRNTIARLIRAIIYSLHKAKLLAPTTGALVGAVVSGIPGAIAGAALAAAIAKNNGEAYLILGNNFVRRTHRSTHSRIPDKVASVLRFVILPLAGG